MLKYSPLKVFPLFFLILGSRAKFKEYAAKNSVLNYSNLPYDERLISWLRKQKKKGRRIILSTGANIKIALGIQNHLKIFDEVIGSNGTENNIGFVKNSNLVGKFGSRRFDYVGNSRDDIIIWGSSRKGIVVNASKKIERKARDNCQVISVFGKQKSIGESLFFEIRAYQWIKNFLIFIPLLAVH